MRSRSSSAVFSVIRDIWLLNGGCRGISFLTCHRSTFCDVFWQTLIVSSMRLLKPCNTSITRLIFKLVSVAVSLNCVRKASIFFRQSSTSLELRFWPSSSIPGIPWSSCLTLSSTLVWRERTELLPCQSDKAGDMKSTDPVFRPRSSWIVVIIPVTCPRRAGTSFFTKNAYCNFCRWLLRAPTTR